ncbi:MAG TPA: hypothetical protein EYM29_11010 [Rhodospirillales bacterium]|nr:MAG: hypothetical protein CFH03_01077 [Alphaproteobacteria bacterium MarineAlpha3_Bin2]HIE20016.1 hypothetical protein [Rhodospirillales bacterium]HIM26119.1 hypothetical protein [Rhodospirillales bacterium]HIM78230.1 hypothetical protein [Rhodospirillales bacterium]
MEKLEFTVHEFMAIMGSLDENLAGKNAPEGSVYNEWHAQWKALDERLEELPMMERADMLFDGKLTINAITEPHLKEVISVVESQVAMHQQLIKDNDEDADPEDLEIWQNRLNDLSELLGSSNWRDEIS